MPLSISGFFTASSHALNQWSHEDEGLTQEEVNEDGYVCNWYSEFLQDVVSNLQMVLTLGAPKVHMLREVWKSVGKFAYLLLNLYNSCPVT